MNSLQGEALVTGGLGFVGKHLTMALNSQGISVATASVEPAPTPSASNVRHFSLDISDEESVKTVFAEVRPAKVFHLAAISLPRAAKNAPKVAFDVNVWGTRNVIDAASKLSIPIRVINVSTSQVYAMDSDRPIDESTRLHPLGEYATTKAMSELLCWQYLTQVETVTVRPFNHSGPGQAPSFVLSYLAQQFALIEAKQQAAKIVAGDLDVERDFTDVRDVVDAYISLMNFGRAGEVYNVCSGHAYRLRKAVDILRNETKLDVEIERDENRIRAGEPKKVIGSAQKVMSLTKWKPKISFDQMMIDSLNYWRSEIAVSKTISQR